MTRKKINYLELKVDDLFYIGQEQDIHVKKVVAVGPLYLIYKYVNGPEHENICISIINRELTDRTSIWIDGPRRTKASEFEIGEKIRLLGSSLRTLTVLAKTKSFLIASNSSGEELVLYTSDDVFESD